MMFKIGCTILCFHHTLQGSAVLTHVKTQNVYRSSWHLASYIVNLSKIHKCCSYIITIYMDTMYIAYYARNNVCMYSYKDDTTCIWYTSMCHICMVFSIPYIMIHIWLHCKFEHATITYG